MQLAQQATLETREGKHEPRSLAEQRDTWAAQARQVLGGLPGVQAMLHHALHPAARPTRRVDAAWVRETAVFIQETLQEHRSYWQRWPSRPRPSAGSAASTRRVAEDPATGLGQAAARYVDSLCAGAEQLHGAQQVAALDQAADLVVPKLTQAGALPTLRAHLLLLAAQDGDPIAHLRAAAGKRELSTADDVAAVLDWRLDAPVVTDSHTMASRKTRFRWPRR